MTATTTELNYLDITTPGTVEASKAVTADANGDVTFPDNEKAISGTGSDLEILHDGGIALLENNDNRIFIQSNNTTDGVLITKKLGTETMAKFIADGGVELNYNNSKSLKPHLLELISQVTSQPRHLMEQFLNCKRLIQL